MIRLFTLSVVFVLAAGAVSTSAQSGRRIPKSRNTSPAAEAPPPDEQPATDSAPAPPPVREGEKISVSTAKSVPTFSIRADVCDAVVRTCAREIGESSFARPMPSEDLSRKQAVELAKANAAGYVLWFQFSIDGIEDPMSTQRVRDPLLVATYILFEPGTGKIRTQGRQYFSSYDSYARSSPSIGGVNRGSRGLSPTETGLRVAAAVLEALEKDLLTRP